MEDTEWSESSLKETWAKLREIAGKLEWDNAAIFTLGVVPCSMVFAGNSEWIATTPWLVCFAVAACTTRGRVLLLVPLVILTFFASRGFLWFLALPVWLICTCLLLYRRKWIGVLALIMNPYFLWGVGWSTEAILDYRAGTGRVLYIRYGDGPPELRFNPRLHCGSKGLGCVGLPEKDYRIKVYNGFLGWLIVRYGPMTGSFDGAYPTEKEACRLLDESDARVTAESLLNGWALYKGKPIELNHQMMDSFSAYTFKGKIQEAGYELPAALYRDRLLLLKARYVVFCVDSISGRLIVMTHWCGESTPL